MILRDAPATAHVAMLAVRGDVRGRYGGLFWLMTAMMWRFCVLSGIRDLRLEATPRTAKFYERLGWPLQVVGELREHWGEPCYPCSVTVREVGGAIAEKASRSAKYWTVFETEARPGQETVIK